MKVSILYFSGTGNTAFVVRALVNSLQQRNMEASLIPMENLRNSHPDNAFLSADLIGIAFPVHAFNPPRLVETLLKELPAKDGKEYFIIKTPGSPFKNGGTTTTLQKILSSKGWKLRYEVIVPMPSNFVVRYSDGFMKLTAQMAVRQTDKIAQDLIKGTMCRIYSSLVWSTICRLMRIEGLGALIYGHYLKVDNTCTLCGLCAAQCPSGNITMENGKLRFSWKCTLCMRCSFCCPVQAFSHKHLGRLAIIKPPYNLEKLLSDNSISPVDPYDDTIMEMKEFRRFWHRNGLID